MTKILRLAGVLGVGFQLMEWLLIHKRPDDWFIAALLILILIDWGLDIINGD